MTKKTETVEEFLARGGKITKVDPAPEPEVKPTPIKSINTPHPHLMSLSDGQFFFAEKQQRKVNNKQKLAKNLDKLSNIPDALKDKLLKMESKDEQV